MPRLLLVENDPVMQRSLQRVFSIDEYFCEVAADAAEALSALEGDPFDLVVLDLGRLREAGLELLRDLRTRHHMPVLMMAPLGNVSDTVAALEIGADDYVCEPFDSREVLGRVRALLRRADRYSRPIELGNRLDLGGVVLDVVLHDAFRDGVALGLTAREFKLLYLFARHPGKALASEYIFENVWGYTTEFGTKALTVNIGRLRRKIEVDPAHPLLLQSIRGFGYRLAAVGE